eukprot:jgi/Phyca11/132850/e_gw1.240.2.1
MEEELVPSQDDLQLNDRSTPSSFRAVSKHGSQREALAAMQLVGDGMSYRVLHNQGPSSATTVYECASHLDCPKRMRLVVKNGDDDKTYVHLEEGEGDHGTVLSKRRIRGIAPVYMDEVDAILCGGAGPTKCRLLLKERHKNSDIMMKLLPEIEHDSEVAYRALYKTTCQFAKKMYDVDVVLRYGSLDHCTAISNSYVSVWPNIVRMSCWSHVARKVSQQRTRLNDCKYYNDVVKTHVNWMHHCRTNE